ncbi:hypothetical protein ACIBF6_21945 [Streptosporangium amethystogenes]|uniref:hypothetical protein n=1 Tax=Streptosporangium amethystogenes TaxID=2002 RepID=UPI0037B18ECD
MAVVLVSGCTPGPSISKADAMAMVNGYLKETLRAVPTPAPVIHIYELGTTSCEYYLDTGPTGQITPGVAHLTEEVGKEKGRKYLADVEAYWEARPGARVKWSVRGDGEANIVSVEPFGDDRRYWLTVTWAGGIRVAGGLDECVWENGTPPPK